VLKRENVMAKESTMPPPPRDTTIPIYINEAEYELLLSILEQHRLKCLQIELESKPHPEVSAVAQLATRRVADLEEKIRSQR
jgi:hypothetical protein